MPEAGQVNGRGSGRTPFHLHWDPMSKSASFELAQTIGRTMLLSVVTGQDRFTGDDMGIMERFEGRLERQAHLMGGMMDRLGVNPERAAQDAFGLDMARATRACLFCRHSDECEVWLSTHPATGAAPDFCRNRSFFAAHGLDAD